MNSREFSTRIDDLRPVYDEKYRELIEKLSQKGDTTGKGNVSTFGAFYQTYMYAYLIGIRLGEKSPLNGKGIEFAPIGKWKPVQLKDFVLVTLFNRANDMEFSWHELETSQPDKVDQILKKLQKELESYANRGLEYIQNKYNTEKLRFEDPNVFMLLLKEIVDKK